MVGGQVTKGLDDGAVMDGDVFDKIDDLLDFDDEELRTLLEPHPWSFDDGLDLRATDWGFPMVAQAPSVGAEAASGSTAAAAAAIRRNGGAFPSFDISLSEFEWLPNFSGEALSPTTIQPTKCDDTSTVKDGSGKVELQYGTLSPVSVLEHNGLLLGGGSSGPPPAAAAAAAGSFSSSSSSSSSPTSSSCCSSVRSGVKLLEPAAKPPDSAAVRGRAPRTKRARPPSGPRSNVHVPIVCSAMDGTGGDSSLSTTIPSFTNSVASEPDLPLDVDEKRKKPKTKIVSSDNSEVPGVRKCMHCEIQKTPQWRAGPMGPKTLCNACGVRYKSGRLFPEYRPAASPTFVASLHSNSHKKVVEMRVRAAVTEPPAVASSLPASAKGCELLNYIRSS